MAAQGAASASTSASASAAATPSKPAIITRPGVPRRPTQGINMGAGYNPLDSFFPYDPCLLRMLHEPIEGSYRTWHGLPGVDDVDETDAGKGDGVDMEGTDEDDEDGEDCEDEMTQSLSSMLSTAMSTVMDGVDPNSPARRGSTGKHPGAPVVRPAAAVLSSTALNGGGFPVTYPPRTAESRSHSMLSDYSLEEDANYSAMNAVPGGAAAGGGGGASRRGAGGAGLGPEGHVVLHLADAGLPGAIIPGERRPRQYSVGSAGSW